MRKLVCFCLVAAGVRVAQSARRAATHSCPWYGVASPVTTFSLSFLFVFFLSFLDLHDQGRRLGLGIRRLGFGFVWVGFILFILSLKKIHG